VYVIDGSGNDDRFPGEDLKSLVMELKNYDKALIKRPSVIFLNKVDVAGLSVCDHNFLTSFVPLHVEKEKMHEHLRRAASRLGMPLLKGR
jgi:GTPase involved in cell partitioning and DNA repair